MSTLQITELELSLERIRSMQKKIIDILWVIHLKMKAFVTAFLLLVPPNLITEGPSFLLQIDIEEIVFLF